MSKLSFFRENFPVGEKGRQMHAFLARSLQRMW